MGSTGDQQPIRVAISGGGVAGASILHALLKYPHIDVHIFEAAPQFREAGVAFGLARQATAALDLIGPSATECLKRAGGVAMQGVRMLLAQGKGAGDLVFEADNEASGKQTTTIVSRADILRELLAESPQERMHASKKLEKVDKKSDGSLLLTFTDGTTHECDILIGADGIHSFVRKIILGDDYAKSAPRNTGWWAVMTLQPYEQARESIGSAPVDIEDAREYGWIGDGSFLMHNVLSNGTLVQFTVCSKEDAAEGSDKWMKEVSAEELKELFVNKGWPAHLDKAVDQLLCDKPKQPAIYFWEHGPARTYVDGPICTVGDAAHATTPWQGSGGGMSIEDSMVLSTLLGRSKTPAEARTALQIYNQIRLPRTQNIVESSHKTGTILTGRGDGVGLDAEKLKPALAPRWDFIVDFDNKKHREEAIGLFEQAIGRTTS